MCERHLPTGNNTRTKGPIQKMHPFVYGKIDEKLITKAAIRIKGGLRPSGLDIDGWQSIIVSSCFQTATSDLCKTIAEIVKKLCTTNISSSNNRTYFERLVVPCRLVPLKQKSRIKTDWSLERY